MAASLSIVALIGRTNVGKSSLFNCLIEQQAALVDRRPGTTRDRRTHPVIWRGVTFALADTGGADGAHADPLNEKVIAQTALAAQGAALVVFVCDHETGVVPADRAIVQRLRLHRVPAIIAVNKVRRPATFNPASYRQLGIPVIIPVSALTGSGTGDLLDAVVDKLPRTGTLSPVRPLRSIILGKPNVGKSSLLNALLGEERAIVHDLPGTTREALGVLLSIDGILVELMDTAGIRRNVRQRAERLEILGVRQSLARLREADLCLFVVDAFAGVGSQDRTLAGHVADANVGVIIVANKWDRIPGADRPWRIEAIRRAFTFLPWALIVPFSAREQKPLPSLRAALLRAARSYRSTLTEEECRQALGLTLRRMPKGKERVGWTLTELRAVGTAPPRITAKLRGKIPPPAALPHIIEKTLRTLYDFAGSPIRLTMERNRP